MDVFRMRGISQLSEAVPVVSVSTLPKAARLGKYEGEFMVFLENISLTACQTGLEVLDMLLLDGYPLCIEKFQTDNPALFFGSTAVWVDLVTREMSW